jgi:preprotein translocase subunit YajC
VNGLEQLLPFVLIAAVFWFLLIRPQRKRQMALLATQRSIELGDEVLLAAGIVGRVVESGDEYLQLEISPGARMKVARGAVVRVVAPEQVTDHATDHATDQPIERPIEHPTDPTDPTRDN